jgi:hypothetical protein
LYPDPDKLNQVTPAEVLDAASRGHLGLDHRFLRGLLDRPEESLAAVRAFAARDRSEDVIDLAPELIALFRQWNTADAVPFLIAYIKEDPQDVPDEVVEALAAIGRPALEPLLALYEELEESESGEVAFLLVSLHIRDERILRLLLERLEYDLSDTLLLLGMYGDPAATPAIERAAAELQPHESELKKEVADTLEALKSSPAENAETGEAFDIWSLYPETEDLPLDLLDEDERAALLTHPVASIRAAAAHSFFNQELTPDQRNKVLQAALKDSSSEVRARAWEALITATDQIEVVEAMLTALRRPELPMEERAGLAVGLAPEADRNEVRKAILDLYSGPEMRAKALEAMWRSMHPSFRDRFAKHLDDADQEIQRNAIWGVGYYGLRSELEKLRQFFQNETLRSDALFAYALVLPTDISKGRMKSWFSRIERDAAGLSEMEEELVKTALDERLMLAGKEPVFREQED